MLGFEILHEDAAILVVNKPAGMLTQAPLGIDSLEVRIKRMLQERCDAGGGLREGQAGEIYLGVPHRIDRPASGVIVFAKTLKAAQKISRQFENRWVEKTYWGLAQGQVDPAAATWTDHLKKTYGKPQSQVVAEGDPDGQVAILHYKVVGTLRVPSPAALLEIRLETGRTHQIRIQCASRGHALLGDELYGSQVRFGPWSDDERERLIALHARTLRFRHPQTQQDLVFTAPLPDIWREAGIDVNESGGLRL